MEIHARVRVRDRLPQQWARALDILLKSADGGRVGALGRELGGGGLDHLARLSELRQRHAPELDECRDRFRDTVGVRLFDERATHRAHLDADEAARLEDPQGVTDRDARDAELLGELALGLETVAG